MSQLNVICLISGGKDSLFSILHCLKHGHKVVALANLHPLISSNSQCEEEEKDMDSFMYQTVGYSIVPLYEQALGIPLYREPIRGSAINADRDYQMNPSRAAEDLYATQGTGEDETESIFTLLQRIIEKHPEANAVSAGAIMSSYQRTRIENVAGRLSLTPLAYLWQYPVLPQPPERSLEQKTLGLLEDMACCGCEARIIKVASGGLDSDFLWENIASRDGATRRALLKSIRSFFMMCGSEANSAIELEGAVLGEGGEYESLALDGPGFLWKQRIVVDKVEKVNGDGASASVRFIGAHCVPKDIEPEEERPTLASVRQPALLDSEFRQTLDGWIKQKDNVIGYLRYPKTFPRSQVISLGRMEDTVFSHGESAWSVSNLRGSPSDIGAKAQMQSIAAKLAHIIKYQNESVPPERMPSTPCTTGDIIFATVLLRHMSDFAPVNEVYASLFIKPNPPARVAIACGDRLPANCDVMCSFLFDKGERRRRDGLHIQSRSYWAPANIGPYSQAISVPAHACTTLAKGRCVYIAGQIPLCPPTMEIAWGTPTISSSWYEAFLSRATLSLQHLWRIGEAMRVNWWLGAIAFLSGEHDIQSKAVFAYKIWCEMHDRPQRSSSFDDENADAVLDAWDIKYGRGHHAESPMKEVRAKRIPDWDINMGDLVTLPPYLAVQVAELPRGSDIEWQALGACASEVKVEAKEVELAVVMEAAPLKIRVVQTTSIGSGTSVFCYFPDIGAANYLDRAFQMVIPLLEGELEALAPDLLRSDQTPHNVLYTCYTFESSPWNHQVVPCRSIWDETGALMAAALVIHLR
ncbi:hypothetical protein KEM56_001712 [Ascosphaera pollenicola]|nr:hypothetical protein KEM56_001712 [Ascosphaera pollenicola]